MQVGKKLSGQHEWQVKRKEDGGFKEIGSEMGRSRMKRLFRMDSTDHVSQGEDGVGELLAREKMKKEDGSLSGALCGSQKGSPSLQLEARR